MNVRIKPLPAKDCASTGLFGGKNGVYKSLEARQ